MPEKNETDQILKNLLGDVIKCSNNERGAYIKSEGVRLVRNNEEAHLLHHLAAIRPSSHSSGGVLTAQTDVEKIWLQIADVFIQNGLDVNACDQEGYSPLHYAAEARLNGMFNLLLENGADPWQKNKEKISPSDILEKRVLLRGGNITAEEFQLCRSSKSSDALSDKTVVPTATRAKALIP